MANAPVPANHPDLEQEPEAAAPVKLSRLAGISASALKALDKGVQRTLQSTADRWTKNRIALIEELPEEARAQLQAAGLLEWPNLTMPAFGPKAAAPAQPLARKPEPAAPARRPEPVSGLAGARVPGVGGYRQG